MDSDEPCGIIVWNPVKQTAMDVERPR